MRKNYKRIVSAAAAAAMAAMQCGSAVGFAAEDTGAELTQFPFVIEGENMEGAELWTSIYQDEIPGYSGEGFAYLANGEFSFTVNVPEDAMYSIIVRGAQILSEEGRMQTITVNGVEYSYTVPYLKEWTDINFGMVRLKAGENTISFINKYGYMAIDYVTVTEAEFPDLSAAADVPSDPEATPEARSLLKYLKSVYGKNILSGQQEIYGGGHGVTTTIRYDAATNKCVDSDGKEYMFDEADKATADDGSTFVWKCYDENGQEYGYNEQNRNYSYNDYNTEVRYLYETTGKYPAIRGFDFNCHNPGFAWEDGVTNRMIDWATNKNGIVTASWHCTVPKVMADFEIDDEGNITKISNDWQQFTYGIDTDFVTANCMIEGTKEYVFYQEAMKLLAAELQKLQDAGVPVIFRPLHEAEGNPGKNADGSGAWFWWSKEGADVYNQLWKLLYTTLTEEYGLHNIIWEQNLYAWSEESALWYTGDDWVDIVGFDKYNTVYNRHDGLTSGPNEDAESRIYWSLVDYVKGNKMVSMPENSTIPSLANLQVEHANWLYFCTWYDDGDKFISDYQNVDTVKEIFRSDYCITLDELPEDLYKNGGETPTKPSESTGGDEVLRGDANCDGSVDLADAVLVMQYSANPDVYGLNKAEGISEQGAENADVVGDGDGITNLDALQIQKYKLGLIDEL